MRGKQGALSPEDLDFEEDDSVEKVGESRYIISTEEGESPKSPDSPEEIDEKLGHGEVEKGKYTYQITIGGQFDGKTVTHLIEEDDIVVTFDKLLRWYAQEVKETSGHGQKSAAEIIKILIAHSKILEEHR